MTHKGFVAVWYLDKLGRERMARSRTSAYRRAVRRTTYARNHGAWIFPLKSYGKYTLGQEAVTRCH